MMNNVLFPDEITGEMLLNQNINEIPTLLEPLLPKSGLVCLAGSSDTEKSAFLRQLSMSVSAGLKTFLGMRLNAEHHSAIYVSTEDDETTAARTSFLYDIRAAFLMRQPLPSHQGEGLGVGSVSLLRLHRRNFRRTVL